jgi:hypothetical protein
MLFAHLKRILKLDQLRLREPSGAHDEFLLAATVKLTLDCNQQSSSFSDGAQPDECDVRKQEQRRHKRRRSVLHENRCAPQHEVRT